MDFKTALNAEIETIPGKKRQKLLDALNTPSKPRDTKPDKPTFKITSESEPDFQRIIFLSKNTELIFANKSNETIQWVDLELPTTFSDAGRRRCVDLIGMRDNVPFLCELKYSNSNESHGDPPHYGILQLLIYYYHAINNAKELHKHSVYHVRGQIDLGQIREFNWEDISKTLIFSANKRYWKYYFYDRAYEGQEALLKLVRKFNENYDLNLLLFKTEEVDFASQKMSRLQDESNKANSRWRQISAEDCFVR